MTQTGQFSVVASGAQTIAWGYCWEDGKCHLRMMDATGKLSEDTLTFDGIDMIEDLYRRTNATVQWED